MYPDQRSSGSPGTVTWNVNNGKCYYGDGSPPMRRAAHPPIRLAERDVSILASNGRQPAGHAERDAPRLVVWRGHQPAICLPVGSSGTRHRCRAEDRVDRRAPALTRLLDEMTSSSLAPDALTLPEPDDAVARSAVRRVGLRLIPFLFICYICAHLDRTNLAIASLQMNRAIHLSAAAYGLGAGLFYVGYALFEVPSNMILARIGARRWIARIMITWGVLAAAMSLMRTPPSFYVLRFLLGVGEAGFFPGVVYYFTNWFTAGARARAVSRFMLAIPIAALVSGALAGPLLALGGRLGLAGWQWLFIVEAVPSVLLGVTLLFYLSDRPEDARWLTAQQRMWLCRQLEAERRDCEQLHGASLRRALTSKRVWQLGFVWAMFYLCANAYTFWAPQIIKELYGRSAGWIGLVLAVISAIGVVTIFFNGVHSDRMRERWLHVAVPLSIATVAWVMLATPAPGWENSSHSPSCTRAWIRSSGRSGACRVPSSPARLQPVGLRSFPQLARSAVPLGRTCSALHKRSRTARALVFGYWPSCSVRRC